MIRPLAIAGLAATLIACGGGDDSDSGYVDVPLVVGHEYALYGAATGRDCGDFASESALHLVDLAAPGRVERLPYDRCRQIWKVLVSPDGRVVVYATGEERAYIVDLASGDSTTTTVLHETGYPWQFTPDGTGIYFVDDAGDLRRYALATRSAGPALNAPGTDVRHFELSADGRYLVYGSWAAQVAVIDLNNGNAEAQVISPGGYEMPETKGFTADGTRIVFLDCADPLYCQWTIGSTDAYYTALLSDPSQVTRLSGALPPGTTFDWPNYGWGSDWTRARGELSDDGSMLGYRLESGPLAIDDYAAADLAFVDLASPGAHVVAPKGTHTHGVHYALSSDGSAGIYRVETRAADGTTVLDAALWRFSDRDVANATELIHASSWGSYDFSSDAATSVFVIEDRPATPPTYRHQLWRAPTDGSAAPTMLLEGGVPGGPGYLGDPRFTHDNAAIVFDSTCCDWGDGTRGNGLWRIPASGGTPVRLSTDEGHEPNYYLLFRAR